MPQDAQPGDHNAQDPQDDHSSSEGGLRHNEMNHIVEENYFSPRTWAEWFRSGRFWELVVCLMFCIAAFAVHAITPHQRPIPFQLLENSGEYVRNLNNNETFEGESVSDTLLVILSYVFPLGIQESMSYFCYRRSTERGSRLSSYDMHATLCVYLLSSALNLLATESVKVYVGYLRPIFYDGCVPDENYAECTMDDGHSIRKSFPSGHSSMSFCGLMLLTLYIHTRFGIVESKKKSQSWEQCHTHPNNEDAVESSARATTSSRLGTTSRNYGWEQDYLSRFISVVSLIPLALALYISTSRIVDNMHFPADVVGGAVLGASVACFAHGLWF